MRAVEAMDMDTITSLLEAGVDPNIEVYKTLHAYSIWSRGQQTQSSSASITS